VGETQQWMAVKERAALDALLYTAVMGTAISKGLELARDYDVVERTREWLGGMLGHKAGGIAKPTIGVQSDVAPAEQVIAKPEAAPIAAVEVPQPASAAEAGVPAAPAAIPAIDSIEVKATPGKGSEYMMKQLWKELQDKHITLPENADPNSDLARLLAADEKSIDSVVHQIASDPKHNFFHDGSSVRIDMGAQMTLGAHGELHLSTEKYDYTFAPAHAPHTEVPGTPPAEAPVPVQPLAQEAVTPPPAEPVPPVKIIETGKVNALSAAQFTERLNPGSSVISPEFNTYFRDNFDAISDEDILKIKTKLLDNVMNGDNEDLKKIFAGKQPADLKIGSYFSNVELLLPANVDGQPVGISFKPDGSFDMDLHKNGLAAPSLPKLPVEVPAPVVETPTEIEKPPVADIILEKPVGPSTIDLTEAQDAAAQKLAESSPAQAMAEQSVTAEQIKAAMAPEHVKEYVNPNKISVDPLKGHVFQDPGGAVLAYGNDYDERFIAARDFAMAHPNTSVWVQANKPVLYEGVLRPWVHELKYGGWWSGMHGDNPDGPATVAHIGVVNPDTFIKQLDK